LCERNEEERRAWLQQAAAIPGSKRIYIDEAGTQDTLTRLFGWSLKGTRCLGERRGHAKERVSMVAAWCQGEVLAPLTFHGSCGADLFEGWFQSQLLPLLEPGQVVILDNATFHRMSILRPLLEKPAAGEEGMLTAAAARLLTRLQQNRAALEHNQAPRPAQHRPHPLLPRKRRCRLL
jgi:hypothetical protein